MENFIDNLLLVIAGVIAVWGIAFIFVAFTAARNGISAHSENMLISKRSLLSSVKGEMAVSPVEEALNRNAEPRSNQGIAINLRTRQVIPQGRLSEEAIDEVLGAKV